MKSNRIKFLRIIHICCAVVFLAALLGSERSMAMSPVDDFLPSSSGFFATGQNLARMQILNSAFQLSAAGENSDVPLIEIIYPTGIVATPPLAVRLIQIDGFDLTKEKYTYRLEVKKLVDEEKRLVEIATLDVGAAFAQTFYSVWRWALRSTKYSPPNGSASGLLDVLHSCFVVGEGRYEGWEPTQFPAGGKMEILNHVAIDMFVWCNSKGRDVNAKARLEKGLAELKKRSSDLEKDPVLK